MNIAETALRAIRQAGDMLSDGFLDRFDAAVDAQALIVPTWLSPEDELTLRVLLAERCSEPRDQFYRLLNMQRTGDEPV